MTGSLLVQQTSPMEIGIGVIDLDRMIAFYSEALGCREVRRADIPAALSSSLTLAPEGYLCVWLETPNGEVIKLMRPPAAPEAVSAPAYLTSRTGIAYLTFYCADLDSVLALAETRGATLRSERDLVASGSVLKLCFFSDPEGNIIELVQSAG